jgi:hypothetical protein
MMPSFLLQNPTFSYIRRCVVFRFIKRDANVQLTLETLYLRTLIK